MPSDIHIVATHGGGVESSHVRAALAKVADDDVSESSPVTAGVSEAGLEIHPDEVHVRVEGHPGDFTKTSQEALVKALRGIGGVDGVEVVEGGYESDG